MHSNTCLTTESACACASVERSATVAINVALVSATYPPRFGPLNVLVIVAAQSRSLVRGGGLARTAGDCPRTWIPTRQLPSNTDVAETSRTAGQVCGRFQSAVGNRVGDARRGERAR